MNTPTRDIQLTFEELNFLAESMAWVIDSSEGFDDVDAMAYKLGIDFQRAIDDINYGHMRVDREDGVQNNTTTKNVSVTEPPITVTQLTTIDETIEDPIVIYYTAEGKLIPDEEDKREVFICVESVESNLKKYLTEEHRYDITHYDRQVISQRGEYKIVPGGDTDGLMNVLLEANNGEFHFFGEAELLLARTEVKDEAIKTWFPKSNGGCFRDYPSNSGLDIEAYCGPDSPCDSSILLDVTDAIYIYA